MQQSRYNRLRRKNDDSKSADNEQQFHVECVFAARGYVRNKTLQKLPYTSVVKREIKFCEVQRNTYNSLNHRWKEAFFRAHIRASYIHDLAPKGGRKSDHTHASWVFSVNKKISRGCRPGIRTRRCKIIRDYGKILVGSRFVFRTSQQERQRLLEFAR